jgi:DNA invertase Pin-like site-specific DNA recombinase
MTSAPRAASAEEGGTHHPSPRHPRSAAAAAANAARARRYAPPTPEEVGRAAVLCFRDVASDEEIARQLGIARRTLARWKQRTEFAAAIAALQGWQAGGSEARVSPVAAASGGRC